MFVFKLCCSPTAISRFDIPALSAHKSRIEPQHIDHRLSGESIVLLFDEILHACFHTKDVFMSKLKYATIA